MVSYSFSCFLSQSHHDPDDRGEKCDRREPDKDKFKPMQDRTSGGELRVTVIPEQIRAFHRRERGKHGGDEHAYENERPPDGLPFSRALLGQLQIDRRELFGKGGHIVRLMLRHGLAEQHADGSIQFLRQRDQFRRIRDRQARFP